MLAWCQEDPVTYACDTLHVTDLAATGGPHDVITATYPGRQVISARISPDGTRVAVVTATPRNGQPGNPEQGTAEVTVEGPDFHRSLGAEPDFSSLGWSLDGTRMYIASNSFQQPRTSIDMWSATTDALEHADLSFGGLFRFVSATEAELGPLPDHVKTPSDCPPADPSGDGTPSDCAFGF
jgi:hypothetical protein